MPYVRKVATKWGDPTLSDDAQIAKVNGIYKKGLPNYDRTDIIKLRKQAVDNGNLLARGMIISEDGKTILITMIWKSEDAYNEFNNNPAIVAYVAAMRAVGWVIETVS